MAIEIYPLSGILFYMNGRNERLQESEKIFDAHLLAPPSSAAAVASGFWVFFFPILVCLFIYEK